MRQIIQRHTRVCSPPLCPEIQLHLITEGCPLWRATPEDLEALDLDEPFWGFAWAGGQALARFILDHPERFRDRRVLDIGCGGGVEAIAAAMAGASHVEAWDSDPLAIETLRLNAELNRVPICGVCGDPLAEALPSHVDMILAGDMSYDQTITDRLLDWLKQEFPRGARALLADPERGFLPRESDLQDLGVIKAPSDVDVGGRFLRDTRILGLGWTETDLDR